MNLKFRCCGSILAGGLALLGLQLCGVSFAASTNSLPLTELWPMSASQDYGALQQDLSVQGRTLKIGDREFAHGLGTHANSRVVYELEGRFTRFESWVGVDAEMAGYTKSSVVFQVFGDGKKLWDSGVMRLATPPRQVVVELRGVNELALVVTDAGDGINCDHADWAEATLFADESQSSVSAPSAPEGPARFQLRAKEIALRLADNGGIVGATIHGRETALMGSTAIGGCVPAGAARVRKPFLGRGLQFIRTLRHLASGRTLTVSDSFKPAGGSIRWEIEVVSAGEPWTAEIATELRYPATAATRFWTAWSDPEHRGGEWRDPLVLGPLSRAMWTYGGSAMAGNYIALPLATLAEPADDAGLSVVLSPEDTILCGSRLMTTQQGNIRFSRAYHRLGGGKPVRFALDLVAHEADWRGGLRWMVNRYPQFFEPPNPHADTMAGCGAYSGDENPIDVQKFKKMAFRVNWKLSDDFPYMGMFIPPVKDVDARWDRSCDEKSPANKPAWTSCRLLNDYARYMKTNGFYVLDYFNVTEFGKHMDKPPVRAPGDPELWKDPRAFLTTQLPGAILLGGSATCYGASVVDPGDPPFQEFVLGQADRHIRWIPDSFGVCIDRLDWLERSNPKADDGVSWVQGKPARSLCLSWMSLLSRLGPKMHAADKVIFVNPGYSRLDLLRQVDGVYTEFGQDGRSLNSTALMCLRKPAIAWSYNDTLNQPDPHSFFQRHLLLGAYPTAPYPLNNHCINPTPDADRYYLEYGPLLDALRGRKWVLAPRCVEVAGGLAKANLFEVPGGWVVPVTFGGANQIARVTLGNVPALSRAARCEILYPGLDQSTRLPMELHSGRRVVNVPLQHGCALLKIARP